MKPGDRLGSYEVVGLVGAGGMGEVHHARDTRLGRDVALKILPKAFADDPERRARFEREARTLATLNHPNIAQVYGVEDAPAGPVLVMEFVTGPTLEEIILGAGRSAPLAMDDGIAWARQLAEALEAAHNVGVVHRDLKPANIKITPDGTVKVLDFGLAKALEPGGVSSAPNAESLTLTSPAMTAMGAILGTAAYMSPEQARGRQVDRRADIWSFGVVLYEMLTGARLFEGDSVIDVLAAVTTRELDLARLPASTPPAVRTLVGRCLDRDPRHRLQAIGEARIVLEHPHADDDAGGTSQAPRARRSLAASPALVAAAVVAIALAAWLGSWLGSGADPAGSDEVRKVDLTVDRLHIENGSAPMISPDGRRVLYRADNALWVRDLSSFTSLALPASHDVRFPAWSSDSRFVVYVRPAEQLWKSPADGGAPVALGPAPGSQAGSGGLALTADGRVLLAGGSDAALSFVPDTGGNPVPLVALDRDRELDVHELSLLPDGVTPLYVVHTSGGVDTIEVLAGGQRKVILRIAGESLAHPSYTSGHLVFERRRINVGVWAVKFSVDRLETEGSPFPVAPEATMPSTSADGTLMFVRQTDVDRDLVWVDRSGAITSIAPLPEWANQPRLSPDGRRAAMNLGFGQVDLWTCDLDTGALSRLTVGVGSFNPVWTPDGGRIIFAGFFGSGLNLAATRSGGTGGVEMLLTSPDSRFPVDVTSDGRTLVHVVYAPQEQLTVMAADGSSAPTPLFGTPFAETWGSLSPDDRWIAYSSNESGRPEVSIRPMAPGAARVPVSRDGGTWPLWSPDGREVFFRQGDSMMAAPVTIRADEALVGRPVRLFEPIAADGLGAEYDVSADGRRFLFVRQRGNARLTLVLNWPAEFGRQPSR